jgi:signal transduction histidine kinase/HAMP domain-containing protein
MFRFTSLSLRKKLQFLIMGVNTLTLLAICSGFMAYEATTFKRLVAQNLLVLCETVASSLTASMVFQDSIEARKTLKTLRNRQSIQAAALYDASGGPFASWVRSADILDNLPGPEQLKTSVPLGQIVVSFELKQNGELLGTLYFSGDMREVRTLLVKNALLLFSALLICFSAVYFLAMRLQRHISGPIEALADTANQVRLVRDYSVRVEKTTEDELGTLVDGFNEMLSGIESRDQELRVARDQAQASAGESRKLALEMEETNKTLAWEIAERAQTEEVVHKKNIELEKVHASLQAMNINLESLVSKRTSKLHHNMEVEAAISRLREDLINPAPMHQKIEWITSSIETHFNVPYCGLWLKDETDEFRLFANSKTRDKLGKAIGKMLADGSWIESILLSGESVAITTPEIISQELSKLQSSDLQMKVAQAFLIRSVSGMGMGMGIMVLFSPDEIEPYESLVLEGLANTLAQVVDLSRQENLLRLAQDNLVDAAHKSGMAEIANSILHNVGNVLNSVNLRVESLGKGLERYPLQTLQDTINMIAERGRDWKEFIDAGPPGQDIPELLEALSKSLLEEHQKSGQVLSQLRAGVLTIKHEIAHQKEFSRLSVFQEEVELADVVADALSLLAVPIQESGIEIHQDLQTVPKIWLARSKLIHILVNLIKNAIEAVVDSGDSRGWVKIELCRGQDSSQVSLSVEDSGAGVSDENLEKVFSYGFTTKDVGHGVGLHASAISVQEMGGKIQVSKGPQVGGALFSLLFPVANQIESGADG